MADENGVIITKSQIEEIGLDWDDVVKNLITYCGAIKISSTEIHLASKMNVSNGWKMAYGEEFAKLFFIPEIPIEVVFEDENGNDFEITDFHASNLPDKVDSSKPYRILRGDVPLFGMPGPFALTDEEKEKRFNQLHDAGVRVIINLAKAGFYSNPDPRRFDYQFFPVTNLGPDGPQEISVFWSAVEYAFRALRSGKGVVVHCQGGTGRTGTVIGGVLRRLELGSGDEIASWLTELNKRRGKNWPESSIQKELVKNYQSDKTDDEQIDLFNNKINPSDGRNLSRDEERDQLRPAFLKDREGNNIPPGFTGKIIAINGEIATVRNDDSGETYEIPLKFLQKKEIEIGRQVRSIRRIVFFDLKGTLIQLSQNGSSKCLPKMAELLYSLTERGWKVLIISRYAPDSIRNLLKESNLNFEYYSSNDSSKGAVINGILKNASYDECVFVDDKPDNLDAVLKTCKDKVRIIGFAGSNKYMPQISTWCKEHKIEFAISPEILWKKLR